MQEPVEVDVQKAIDEVTRRRGWPWQVPGRRSVGLDDHGRIVEGVADEDGEITVTRVLGAETSTVD